MGLGRLFGKRSDRDDEAREDDATLDERTDDELDEDDPDGLAEDGPDSAEDAGDERADAVVVSEEAQQDDTDWVALDEQQEWRSEGPWDVDEVDPDDLAEPNPMRIDLGSLLITGFEGMELRLQIAEESGQVVSALMMNGESALEVAAFGAPRSGGLWSELRSEIIEATAEAGGTVAHAKGPFGTELRRLLPVTTPDGEQGYQPSRMWVAQGPRWCLRGVLYGEAAVTEGLDGPVAVLLDTFRSIIVRRGDDAKAPGDLLPLNVPEGAQAASG